MPRVSVLVAAYNAEAFVGDSVRSILDQTFRDLELIVVDDGSTDSTLEVLHRVEDPRLVVLPQPENRGIAPTMNVALDRASGELIAIHDADDVSVPTRLAEQTRLLDERPEVVVAGSAYRVVAADGAPRGVKHEPPTDTGIRWRGLFTIPFLHPSMIFRAAVAREHGLRYDPEMLYGGMDHKLACALLDHGRGANSLEPLVVRRMHEAQVTKTKVREMTASSDQVTVSRFEALGIEIDTAAAAALRELYYRPPARLRPDDLPIVSLMLDALAAFARRPEVDAAEARAIRRAFVDTVLARSRGNLRELRSSGLLERLIALDRVGVATSPLRWLARRVR